MIGSEGTLGFVSQATYNTVPEWPHKARAPLVMPPLHVALPAPVEHGLTGWPVRSPCACHP